MDSTDSEDVPSARRRALLAGAGGSIAALAGCVGNVRNILGRDEPNRITLTIAAVPADVDPIVVQIANRLRSNLQSIGIATTVDLLSLDTFRLEVLINHDFDIAITRHPGDVDPDFLYAALHSRFGPEGGWQNPYGYADLELDDDLAQQRHQSGVLRLDTVGDVLETVCQNQPFNPLVFPTERRVYNPNRLTGIDRKSFDRIDDLLRIVASGNLETLTVAIRNPSPTRNLNPLSVEYRTYDAIIGLLYDHLAVAAADEPIPWLAESLDWHDEGVSITLRESEWHDGERLTAEDVAFTYRMLADTTLGDQESPIPTSRYRGRIELVENVDVTSIRSLDIELDGDPAVAARALEVPIFPEHVWADRTDQAEIAGIELRETITQALIHDNMPPVGSGPYRYVDHSMREALVLEQVEGHFVNTDDALLSHAASAERIRFDVAPSDQRAIEMTVEGETDLTLDPIDPTVDIDRYDPPAIAEANPTGFYHVAYNTRNRPLSNPNFRRVISRLLDKSYLLDRIFDGYGRPTATPVGDDDWVPGSLQWNGADPEVPFFGSNGVLDAAAARSALTDAGYRYDEEGFLLGRQ